MLVFSESTGCSEEDGPYWLTSEERLKRRDDKFLEPFLDKAKTTSELRKEWLMLASALREGTQWGICNVLRRRIESNLPVVSTRESTAPRHVLN
jgi:hypothetical protein